MSGVGKEGSDFSAWSITGAWLPAMNGNDVWYMKWSSQNTDACASVVHLPTCFPELLYVENIQDNIIVHFYL